MDVNDTSDIKSLLVETHALAKDNHRMLRAIRRDQWFGFAGKIIVWAVVILLPLYLYNLYVAPLISQYQGFAPSENGSGFPSFTDLQKLIDSYKSQ